MPELQNSNSKLPMNILTLSGNSEEELDAQIQAYKNYFKLDGNGNSLNISDIAFTASTLSPHLPYRAAVLGTNCSEIADELDNLSFERGKVRQTLPKVCFLFTGQGASYHQMGRSLYDTSFTFRRRFDYCDELLKSWFGLSVKGAIFGDDKEKVFDTAYSNITLLVVEECLKHVWAEWGIKPDCVLGHSVGEYEATISAGILSLEHGIKIAGVLPKLAEKLPLGGMIALATDKKTTEELIHQFTLNNNAPDLWLELAVTNSNTQTVVAGDPKSIPIFHGLCKTHGVKAYILPMSNAYHSRGVDSCLDEFRKVTATVEYKKPVCEYISALTGTLLEDDMDPEYSVNHIRHCVKFQDACHTVYDQGARVFVEIGPQPLLCSLMMQNVQETPNSDPITLLPSMMKTVDGNEWAVLMESLAKLYVMGYPINWQAVYSDFNVNKVTLPIPNETKIKLSEIKGSLELSSNQFWKDLEQATGEEEKKQIIQHNWLRILKLVLKRVCTEIGLKQDIRELGINSLKGIQMKAYMQQLLGVGVILTFNDLIDCFTVEHLTNKIFQLIYNNTKEDKLSSKKELKQLIREDSVLWSHIQPAPDNISLVPVSKIKTILLTGATGNLAPYILELLTKRPETEKVYCIVREGRKEHETPTNRLETHLKSMKIWDRVDMSKVHVIAGNIPNEFLGMEEDSYNKLAEEVDAVIHCAVTSNHLAKYQKGELKYCGVRAVNVIGTQRIFEFSAKKKTKWVYHASTFLALYCWNDADYHKLSEDWPEDNWLDFDDLPNFGYGISKYIADVLAHEAVKRGIPCKAFRFPKINGDTLEGRQGVMDNHFFVKFLYYIISGVMPDIDLPLQLMPVDTCAEISLRVFYDERAPSDMYNVVNPHPVMEFDIAQLVDEFGPQLRILAQVGRMVEKEGEEATRQKWKEIVRSSGPLAKVFAELEKDNVNWLDDPATAFGNESVRQLLNAEFGYSLKIVEYDEFVKKLVQDGEDALLFNWIEFYTKEDCLYKLGYAGKYPLLRHWTKDPAAFIRGGKIETLYSNLKELVENPLNTMRRDIQFAIKNSKEIFAHIQ